MALPPPLPPLLGGAGGVIRGAEVPEIAPGSEITKAAHFRAVGATAAIPFADEVYDLIRDPLYKGQVIANTAIHNKLGALTQGDKRLAAAALKQAGAEPNKTIKKDGTAIRGWLLPNPDIDAD